MTDCTCNQTICICRDFTWRHAVLEIYEPDEGWPGEGKVAEWVHDHRVGFCDGSRKDLVLLTPLVRILAWKLRYYLESLWQSLTWRFRKVDFEAWDILSDEALQNFEEQLDE